MIRVFDTFWVGLWVGLAIAFAICFVCVGPVHASPIDDRARGGASAGAYDLMGECLKFAESADADTYLCRSGADEVTLTCGAAAVWICNASGCDLAGELGSVTSLDATTETTIETAIDTLGDIAVGSIAQGDDKSVCQGADTDFCCEWDTDGTEGLLCTAADCDGLGGSCTAAHVYEDSGNLIADLKGIDSITNSSQKITIGPPGASSHSLGANELHIKCTRNEFDGNSYFDGGVYMYGGLYNVGHFYTGQNYGITYGAVGLPSFIPFSVAQTNAASIIVTPTTSNTLYLLPSAYSADDYGIAAQTNQTIIGAADQDPASDATKYFMLSWNRLTLGGNGGGLGCINQTFSYDDMVDGGGASGTLVLDEGIPDGARVDQSILHSLTGFTGDTSAVITIGDGTDVDRYNTGTPSVFTTNASGCDLGVPSGTAWHDDAKNVTVTITSNADFTSVSAGEATISICYWTP